ncbi:hypothetical protein I3843_08G112100 [Carya illinoinensis]|uniref:Uncharacterized protein n=1 Tax=Carya illinoinensis TaxID=32201 RepID=A0A922JB87_CARIL|nr:hypothetical protein I3842_08G116300 [Carya illinoinensis]KAG7967699.1 hypothetical protein I3843_08G112100 [Carya illinoinensis]
MRRMELMRDKNAGTDLVRETKWKKEDLFFWVGPWTNKNGRRFGQTGGLSYSVGLEFFWVESSGFYETEKEFLLFFSVDFDFSKREFFNSIFSSLLCSCG